jgi:hypothetical protein
MNLNNLQKFFTIVGAIPSDIHATFLLGVGVLCWIYGHKDVGEPLIMAALAIFKGTK